MFEADLPIEKHKNFAYRIWQAEFGSKEIDDQISLVLDSRLAGCSAGRLQPTRLALLYSTGELARRIRVSRRSYIELERSDSEGTIKLKTLSKIAAALDCELIYVFRPKSKKRYSQMIWEKLLPAILDDTMYRFARPNMKALALAGAARRKMLEPGFVRAQGWSQRRHDAGMIRG